MYFDLDNLNHKIITTVVMALCYFFYKYLKQILSLISSLITQLTRTRTTCITMKSIFSLVKKKVLGVVDFHTLC